MSLGCLGSGICVQDENFAIDDKGLEGFVTLSDIAYYLFVEVEEFLAMKGSSADRVLFWV